MHHVIAILLLTILGCTPQHPPYILQEDPDIGFTEEEDIQQESPDIETEERYGFCLIIHWCSNIIPVECYHGKMWVECEKPDNRRSCQCDTDSFEPPWKPTSHYIADQEECPWLPPDNIPGRFMAASSGRWSYPHNCLEQ